MKEFSLYIIILAFASFGGYYLRSLTRSGAFAAFMTGCFVALGFHWEGLILLGAFFASSSFWSSYKKQRKLQLGDMLEKGAARDWIQVAANGSVASLASLFYFVSGDQVWAYAFFISIAASNSDTWASEIGVLSKSKPYDILSLRHVEKGTSGAVSFLGTLASLSGSLFVAVFVYFLFSIHSLPTLLFIAFYGFLGSVVDTILGATIQARFTCSSCGIVTEKTVHCSTGTTLKKGIKWFNNDVVNVTSIFIATAVGVGFFFFFA